jgi:nitrate reductase beta subunit
MYGSGPFGESSGTPVPVAVENFHALKVRQTSEAVLDSSDKEGRINLLNWDGKGTPSGLFPGDGGDS